MIDKSRRSAKLYKTLDRREALSKDANLSLPSYALVNPKARELDERIPAFCATLFKKPTALAVYLKGYVPFRLF